MNLVPFEAYEKVKKELILRRPLFYSFVLSFVLFIVVLFSGQIGAAFVTFLVVFILLFVLSYGILWLQTKGVLRKTKNFEEQVPHLNVSLMVSGTFVKEEGLLCFYDDHIVYKGLLAGAANKEIALEINEDLFIGYGEIKRRRRDKFIDGDYQQCFVMVRPMPHGVVYKFKFNNIDDSLSKVAERIDQISQFNSEKFQ
ncbi:hypothetical protein [Candidatus Xianfuyuplasma coldseepsis]|uniref:Uncharacterized protein n=1 Tax=Candidatus Xianfuyuplasma coldseepsis TaxID=2782163 RepID=A0A7L7KQU1_9MOLU|nr:hypothetical protein [Xianfuyuplasma coldseepsis]QMS84586.1 hypothetical protein G4Z02_02080 [Xianfuyuplasma coldseepsis]